ncbi:divalent metal cation transporter [Klebsiella pneumoniae]
MLQRRGQKPLEKVIGGLLLFVAVAYVGGVDLFPARAGSSRTKGLVIPTLPNGEAVFLAAGVLGATIMPHVIYLHSSLTQHLHGGTRKERYTATRWDVAIATDHCRVRQSGDDGDRCGGIPL